MSTGHPCVKKANAAASTKIVIIKDMSTEDHDSVRLPQLTRKIFFLFLTGSGLSGVSSAKINSEGATSFDKLSNGSSFYNRSGH